MDSKGSSLPSMPEPANPVSMKQPPESLAVHKARGDMSVDPSMLMDQAAAQLAATLQDSVLQKMSNHTHNNHGHETLKDLTSLVLNGDQDAIPKLCAAETPILKGAESPPSSGTHQLTCSPHGEPELKVTIPQVVQAPVLEPCSAGGTSLSAGVEGTMSAPEQRQEEKRGRGRPSNPKPQPRPGSSGALEETLGFDPVCKAGDEPAVICQSLADTPKVFPMQRRFSVGDVVWTKVSGYPWWPCIVTTDPEFNHHFKLNGKSRSGLTYHVQYFGDAPERGYIFEKNMVSFAGEDQYQELSLHNNQPASCVIHKKTLQSVPRMLRPQWKMGVIQATEALVMTLDDRLATFTFVYDDSGPHLNPCILDKLKPEPGMEAETRLLLGSLAQLTAASQSRDGTFMGTNTQTTAVKQGEWLDGLQTLPQDHMVLGSVVHLKKKRRPRQPQPRLQTNRRRKPANRTKVADGSLSGSAPAKRRSKQIRTTALDVNKNQQPKRRRKNSTSEGADEKPKKRRRKIDKEVKTSNVPLADVHEAEKQKRQRKRVQNGDNPSEVSKAKKRRLSLCPELEGSGSEGCPDSPSDSLDGMKKCDRKKEFVCQVCEQAGEDLLPCEGQCCGMFHVRCLSENFKADDKLVCQECSTRAHSCFTCKRSDGEVRRCHVANCGKFYHEACARLSPLTVFDNKGFRCPLHTCLSCHYGCSTQHKSTKGRLMRCLRCPVAYHVGDLCVAAGSEMVTNTAIVCTNHFHAKKGYSHHSHVNVSWCFVCSKGGQLLCCESCPAAFHPDCLNIAMPDGSWFCNDCRAGKKPKYRDIIWVKLGTYRWWPAEIQHPRNIPTNIQHLRHEIGEFPVFFFGSKDYFWTHQGRVFPYMEGDRGSKYHKTGIGKVFKTALMEAEARFKSMKMKLEAKEAQAQNRKPPPYKSIKVNKPVGKVQVYAADIAEIPKCNCKPSVDRPCGFESECLNRMLQYECHPQVCPSGQRCCNQDFTKRRYPETKIIKTPGKGWGLISLRDIKKGEFVNEYIGELVDEDECRARIKYAHENNITDFYMLTIDKDRIIDAGPKGNYSRFMNHSCQPNCETQKWTVNGDTRVGLFAVCDIPSGTELTFNYNLDCLGNEKTVCRCGAPNCSGFLGDRPKNSSGAATEPKGKRLKRKCRKRRAEGKKSDDECFRCGDGGQLVICGKKTCTKAFHLSCLNLSKRPFGRWDCPWHHCDVCGKNSDAFCQLCPNSFCKVHQEGALRPCPPTAQLCCMEHDEQEARLKLDQAAAILSTKAGRARVGEGKGKRSRRKAAEA
ncbi:histone-lysine N-methyltransferase NSD2 [Nerophis lumbriciformis]|uniref:histone-lysine N-methyltransferase NSD2 n=1 Tax=Nerophis lumbriciformis TaxID=546530 RepID=UPI002AE08C1D|nr:histone-lysine N-methyltransferase NSD2 [Nerophis lumbriciformis]XP_061781092.1 histone-lysine N-methyltransferase NSD2 [Nerophis lumbriciformis]XP_061781094.1 histone-lysine N-methyltransferase NSD2 [Nerophis lumbriciformis]